MLKENKNKRYLMPYEALQLIEEGKIEEVKASYITNHFQYKEVFANLLDEDIKTVNLQILSNAYVLANQLEDVKAIYDNKSLIVHSWFRSLRKNREVGGKLESLHLTGEACDFHIQGLDNKRVQVGLQAKWRGGMGSYNSFTHLDIRPYVVRWEG